MDESNKMNETNYRNLTRLSTPVEFDGTAADVIDKCIATISAQQTTDDQVECNIFPLKITMCIKQDLMSLCPTALQENSPRCVQKRAKGNKDEPTD